MSKYVVTSFDTGETEIEAQWFQVSNSTLVFYADEKATQPVAMFSSWLRVIKQ